MATKKKSTKPVKPAAPKAKHGDVVVLPRDLKWEGRAKGAQHTAHARLKAGSTLLVDKNICDCCIQLQIYSRRVSVPEANALLKAGQLKLKTS